MFANIGPPGVTATHQGEADTDKLLERIEVYELELTYLGTLSTVNNKLTNNLGVNTTFNLEVIPPKGAVF